MLFLIKLHLSHDSAQLLSVIGSNPTTKFHKFSWLKYPSGIHASVTEFSKEHLLEMPEGMSYGKNKIVKRPLMKWDDD